MDPRARAFVVAHEKLVDTLLAVSERWDAGQSKQSQTTRRLLRYRDNMGAVPIGMSVARFKRLLERSATSIVRGPTFDAWLKNVKLMVELPQPRQASGGACEMHLGALYAASLELRDEVQLALDASTENPELSERYATCRELILPAAIKLYLYRIFSSIVDTPELYAAHLRTLEEEMGLAKGGDDVRQMLKMIDNETGLLGKLFKAIQPTLATAGVDAAKALEIVGDLAEHPDRLESALADPHALTDMLKSVMSAVAADGATLGAGDKKMTIDDMGAKAMKLLTNPTVQKVMGQVREGNAADPMALLTQVAGNLDDPEAMAIIAELTGREVDPSLRGTVQNLLGMAGNFLGGAKPVAPQGPLVVENAHCDGDVCVRPPVVDEFEE